MKKLFTLVAFVVTMAAMAQSVAISDDGSVADASAILDIKSTTKGFLPPRMTAVQREAIQSPATGLQIWCSDCNGGETQIFDGSIWSNFAGASGPQGETGNDGSNGSDGATGSAGSANISGTTNHIIKFTGATTGGNSKVFDDGTNVGIGTTTPAAKLDVAGTLKITDGTEGAGKVLTSDAAGLASWTTPAVVSVNKIIDADANTKIQVEKNANEDIIRFDIAGTEKWVMQGSRLEPKNTGNSIFIGEGAGTNDDLTENNNVFIGYQVGVKNTTGNGNVANGYQSLINNTIGNNNTSSGLYSSYNNTGSNNVATGASAGLANITGSNNTFIGNVADASAGDLDNATAIGNGAIVNVSNKVQIGDNAVTTVQLGTASTVTLETGAIKLTAGNPELGKVLTSDADGLSSWQYASSVQTLAKVVALGNTANGQLKNVTDPTDPQDAATKAYVDLLESQISNLQAQISTLVPAPLPSVTIGTAIWQNINLDVTTYRDGTVIPQVRDANEWMDLKTGAWCYYNNDANNGTTYGKLYNWYAVKGITTAESTTPTTEEIVARKKLAPRGWHIPTDGEWSTLTTFLDQEAPKGNAGGKMKDAGTAHWNNPNVGATNSSGFTGLPGGYRDFIGPFYSVGYYGYWWSSTESNTSDAWYRDLVPNNGNVGRSDSAKTFGFSVRCLRD